jgi:hypothetical protein
MEANRLLSRMWRPVPAADEIVALWLVKLAYSVVISDDLHPKFLCIFDVYLSDDVATIGVLYYSKKHYLQK